MRFNHKGGLEPTRELKSDNILTMSGETLNLRERIVSIIDRDPIILSHHPLCGRFRNHVFKIRGRYVCIGCATVYPSALATIIFAVITNLNSFSILFPIALSSFGVNLIRISDRSHRFSVLFNLILGISLGTSFLSAIYVSGNYQLIVFITLISIASVFSFLKGYRIFAICRSCPGYAEFPYCHDPKSHEIIEYPSDQI